MSDALRRGAEAIRGGRLVVVPTDTVYGLAAKPDDPAATAAVFAAKGRGRAVPLPVLVPDVGAASGIASLDARAIALADAWWPGPLTLVVPRAGLAAAWDLGGDAATIGVRVPAHPVARRLLELTGPLAVTSANASGQPPATTCDGARAVFGEIVAVYLCQADPLEGMASTVVDLAHGPALVLRRGGVGADELARLLPAGEPLLDSRPSP